MAMWPRGAGGTTGKCFLGPRTAYVVASIAGDVVRFDLGRAGSLDRGIDLSMTSLIELCRSGPTMLPSQANTLVSWANLVGMTYLETSTSKH